MYMYKYSTLFNPLLLCTGGGGGALISKIHIFAMNTTAMTFGDYS